MPLEVCIRAEEHGSPAHLDRSFAGVEKRIHARERRRGTGIPGGKLDGTPGISNASQGLGPLTKTEARPLCANALEDVSPDEMQRRYTEMMRGV